MTPVLFLTARDTLDDKAAGCAAGADDYLTKPFSLAELKMRVRAILRRAGAGSTAYDSLRETVAKISRADVEIDSIYVLRTTATPGQLRFVIDFADAPA